MAFDAYALILAMLALGIGFGRTRLLPANAAEVLNLVVLYVCLPAAVLLYLPKLELEVSLLAVIATPWLLVLVTFVLVGGLSHVMGLDREVQAVLLLCVGLGNTSFIGFPMVRALIGEAALPYAVVYDQFGSFLLLSTFGIFVLARYGSQGPPTGRQIAARIMAFPPLWALVLGLTLMPADPPVWIASGLQRLADALLPMVMLAVGLSIQLKLSRRELLPLGLALVLKLSVMPGIALLVCWLFGLSGDALRATVLESAMPPMITAAALAISHSVAPRLAAAIIGYGILLSLGTLPSWMWLLQRL